MAAAARPSSSPRTTGDRSSWIPERPLSVEQIVDYAGKPFFDPQFSVRNWFRTSDSMVKQANVYEHENNEQVAYFLLYRHASLILDELPKHPDAKHPDYRKYWSEARKAVNKSLAKLEVLKPKINKRYLKHEDRKKQAAAAAAAAAQEVGEEKASEAINVPQFGSEYDMLSALDIDANALDPAQHKDIAIELANEQVQKGRATSMVGKQPQDHSHEEGKDWDRGISRDMLRARRQMDLNTTGQSTIAKPTYSTTAAKAYQYPTISQPHKALSPTRPSGPRSHQPLLPTSAPPKPPKSSQTDPAPATNAAFSELSSLYPHEEQSYRSGRITPVPPPPSQYASGTPPPIPRKEIDNSFASTSTSHTTPTITAAPPTVPAKRTSSPVELDSEPADATSNRAARQFFSSSQLEDGTPLRTIFLPSGLRHEFVQIAAANTARNLETCGILCGVLMRNAFFITKLVIPEQSSTSDTCEMVNEEALYEFCDSKQHQQDLLVLGWIHTHPTQTCFMSSRDLHTHCWYQVSLAESIAIVCAPSKDPDWGIFRLTDPPGVRAIRTCNLPGIFHPHAETRLFTDALGRPGHVIEHQDLQFDVVDLRAGK